MAQKKNYLIKNTTQKPVDVHKNIRAVYEKYKDTALDDLAGMIPNGDDYMTETWYAIKRDLGIME